MDGGPKEEVSRRDFVKGAVLIATGAAIGTGATLTTLSALDKRDTTLGPSPLIRRSPEDNQPIDVRVSDLEGDAVQVLTAEWEFRPAVLYKVRTETLRASSSARGYNTGQFAIQHPTEPDHAILAYDGKCTHLGCTVGWHGELGASRDIADYEDDGTPDGRILCPCHQAQYDIFDFATHLSGTPAPRPLDALRIQTRPDDDDDPTLYGVGRFYQATARAADRQGPGAPFQLDA